MQEITISFIRFIFFIILTFSIFSNLWSQDTNDIAPIVENDESIQTNDLSTISSNNSVPLTNIQIVPKQKVIPINYEINEGIEAYDNGDFAQAKKIFESLAQQQNTQAMNRLGNMYLYGIGTLVDHKIALKLFGWAAEAKDPEGQNNLATMYLKKLGGKTNFESIIQLFTNSANQDYLPAMINLGDIYYIGVGVERSYPQALDWYTKAADENDSYAILKIFQIGNQYFDGKDVIQDYKKAIDIYKLAADKGMDKSKIKLADLYLKGEIVERDLDEAESWLLKAAENGNHQIFYQIGSFYEKVETKKSPVLAYAWYNLAAANGQKKFLKKRKQLASQLSLQQRKSAQKFSRECIEKKYTDCNQINLN